MSTIREALNSAFEAQEGGTQETAPPAPEAVEAAPAEAAPAPEAEAAPAEETRNPLERARDDAGKFTKAPKAKPAAVKPTVVQLESKPPAQPEAPAPAPEAPKAEALRAPQSWTPEEREFWAKAPPEVQRAILRQDAEVRRVMREAAPARKFHQDFNALTAPYAPLMGGTEPLAAIRGMLQTVATLSTGSQQQRAGLLANLIRGYGVDINSLAAALDGQPAQGQPQAAQPLDVNSVYQQVYQRISQDFAAQAQRQQAQSADAEVARFAQGHEFLDDVADEMAALMDAAARRGRELSYEDAYAMACRAHPEVSKVVAQREAAARATANLAATQRARTASSSVRTQPTATPNGVSGNSVRSALEAAAERLTR